MGFLNNVRGFFSFNQKDKEKDIVNAFNKAFYEFIGGQGASYDYDRKTYLEKGYGRNPDVYAIIQQQADKINSVPYYVHDVEDEKSLKQLKTLEGFAPANLSLKQLVKRVELKNQAFNEGYKPFPLEKPNPNQTWKDIFALYQVFMQTTGNFFLYMVKPEFGVNKGQPSQVYVLPSHLMKIVIKDDADVLSEDNVIDHYMLVEGNQTITFDTDDVIHVKLPNPFFDFQGSHLYGLSPMRALLRNIESSNDAIDQNIKTLKNGGVFGFISAKENTIGADQAQQIKERMRAMDADRSRLSNIAGLSFPIEFTKLSLSTDELKPFDYLRHDQKTICNVLGWSDKLLNNDEGAKYDNLNISQRNVVINHIMPRLGLLEEKLNADFIPLFKGYENSVVKWDYTELPEMQQNIRELVESYSNAPISPNELRLILNMPPSEIDGMDMIYIDGNKRAINEVSFSDLELDKAFGNES